ncbi:MAG: hypothetical protein V3V16_00320 [Melioribacteraceae bacterium]
MNSIDGDVSAQMQGLQMQGDQGSKGSSKMETMAKSMGVPDEVISKGKSAVKAWMKENGKMPGSMKNDSGNKVGKNSSNFKEQLNANGISHESFAKALQEGPEATEKLFSANNFSFNVIA